MKRRRVPPQRMVMREMCARLRDQALAPRSGMRYFSSNIVRIS